MSSVKEASVATLSYLHMALAVLHSSVRSRILNSFIAMDYGREWTGMYIYFTV